MARRSGARTSSAVLLTSMVWRSGPGTRSTFSLLSVLWRAGRRTRSPLVSVIWLVALVSSLLLPFLVLPLLAFSGARTRTRCSDKVAWRTQTVWISAVWPTVTSTTYDGSVLLLGALTAALRAILIIFRSSIVEDISSVVVLSAVTSKTPSLPLLCRIVCQKSRYLPKLTGSNVLLRVVLRAHHLKASP